MSQPSLLVVCDSNSPTNHHSLLAPLAAGDQPVVVVAPEHVTLDLPGDGWQRVDEGEALGGIRAVASSGDHLGTGDGADDLARHRLPDLGVGAQQFTGDGAPVLTLEVTIPAQVAKG